MPIAKFEDLLPWAIPHLPHCPPDAILQAIREGWREFATDSEVWRVAMDPVDLVAGQSVYTLIPTYQAHIHAVDEVWWRTSTDVANNLPGHLMPRETWQTQERPQGDLALDLRFLAAPNANVTKGLVVRVTYIPLIGSLEEVGALCERWGQYIWARAVSNLAGETGQPWSNASKAAQFGSVYRTGLSRARRENVRGRKHDFAELEA